MPLSSLISTAATIDSFRAARPSFGKPTIVDEHAALFADVSKDYSDRQTLIDDGFSASGAVVSAFSALVGQEPSRPPLVTVVRRETPVAQVDDFTVTGTADGVYTVPINGVPATFTASTNTADEIRDGIIAAINGLSEAVTAGNPTSGAFDVTADNAGQGFVVGALVSPGDVLASSNTTANVGVFSDLTAARAFDPRWYAVLLTSRTTPDILEAARWTATERAIYIAQSDDSDILSSGSTTDVASQLLALSRANTLLVYKSNDTHFADFALAGRQLPKDVGSTNWAWQALAGVQADTISVADQAVLEAKRCGWVEDIGGLTQSFLGMTSQAGQWVDLRRGKHKVESDIVLALADVFSSEEKIDQTEREILRGAVESAIRGNLQFVDQATVSVTLEPLTAVELSNREDNGIRYSATLRTPINKSNSSGTLSIGGVA